jgi:hypothetical protein
MNSYIQKQNKEIYLFEFKDSHYKFAEDLDDNIEYYSSLNQVRFEDIQELLFIIHFRILELQEEDFNKDIIEIHNLSKYGHGNDYDENEELYYILDNDFFIENMNDEQLVLNSASKHVSLFIDRSDVELFFKDAPEGHYGIGDTVSFDHMLDYIFINKNKHNELIKKLHHDVNNLNELYKNYNMSDRIITITSPKQH